MMRMLLCGCFVLGAAVGAGAQVGPGTASPPMGWNSWDSYGLRVDEGEFRANVAVMKAKLAAFGYRYAVVDEGWFMENPAVGKSSPEMRYAMDAAGRFVPAPERFPSAAVAGVGTGVDSPGTERVTMEATSFAALAKWVHAQGLLFGIHIVRGIPRAAVERNLPIEGSAFHAADAADTADACPWDKTNWGVKDNAAGQAWYDSVLKQYAGWGVDLLKVDCIAAHPYKGDEIRMIRRAMDKAGRPMVLSLSPGPAPVEKAAELAENATMWRVSEDVWDVWAKKGTGFPQSVKGQFERAEAWAPLDIDEGHWPDMDMLPVGELRPSPGWGQPRSSKLTLDEQRTMLTLWAMRQSPLIVGANLTLLDAATLKLLTNREVIRLDQASGMTGGRSQPNEDNPPLPAAEKDLQMWSAWDMNLQTRDRGGMFAAMFNLGDAPLTVEKTVGELGLLVGADRARAVPVYDVWAGRELGRLSKVKVTIPARGCVLLERR